MIYSALLMLTISMASETTNSSFRGDELVEKYKSNLSKIENFYKNVHASGILTQRFVYKKNSGKPDQLKQFELNFFESDGQIKLTRSDIPSANADEPPAAELVYVDNGDRLFVVQRKLNTTSYSLNHLGERKTSSLSNMNRYVDKFFKSPFTISGSPISAIIKLPGFKIISFSPLKGKDDSEEFRIAFNYAPPSTVKPGPPWTVPLKGWWTVDPANGWGLKEFAISSPGSPETWTGRVDYSNKPGEPLLLKTVVLNEGADYDGGFVYEFKCDTFSYSKVSQKEFALASFGLGDAEIPPGQASIWSPYWFFGLAAIAIVISGVLRRRANQ